MVKFFETEESINKNQIKVLEQKLDFDFPVEYKEHLLKYNGGRCDPCTFSFVENGQKTASAVDWFLAIYDGQHDNLETYFNDYKVIEKRMPDSIFPIANDPGGNAICMDATDSKIYFWDHEKEVDYSYSDDSDRSNLYLIAESLNEFISILNSE